MQGNLSEIDIRSILQLIELGQRTGELFVEAYSASVPALSAETTLDWSTGRSGRNWSTTPEHTWIVFFVNGQIVYAGDARNDLLRLRDHLRRYRIKLSSESLVVSEAIATTSAPEYGHLWAMLENHTLTPAQGRSIIHSMVQETLFDLLSLHHGSFIFELSPPLAPQLTTLEISPLIVKIMKQVQEWKQFHPVIQSPDQCPAIANAPQLREALKERTFLVLEKWVDGQTSIRQIARYLNRDIPTVARAIYPFLEQGFVQLVHPDAQVAGASRIPIASVPSPPRIVCIDDGAAIRRSVEEILQHHGYEATSIGNPVKALSLLFQLKPDLILCDISMPDLDGYEICAMLRKSTAFRQTPIVMLTGRDGFIDRVRARMVGATNYLTKPFGEYELLTLVEAYVGRGDPGYAPADQLLAEDLEKDLKIGITESASAAKRP